MVVAKIQAKLKEVDERVKAWVAKQPAPMEVALVTVASSLQGGFIGVLMGTFAPDMPKPPMPPAGAMTPDAQHAMKQMQALTGGPWIQARNFAVMTGVNAGISCAMRRIRKIPADDLQTSMVSAMGSGMAFSLISGAGTGGGPGGPNPIASAISTGVVFSVFQGGFFQVGKMISGGAANKAADQMDYEETTTMLKSLGLEKYEKNFKKGMLSDRTLPLLSDSALQEVKIPAGPRLMILDHIKRSKDDSWPEDAVPSEQ